ncbi:MAG: peptidase U32, partial [Alphaproteobacteria bacterium]|nr:peptidase U32 [Alphaproteobacteria bacterium]
TLADWEYAGTVMSVEDDAFFIEAKNKLEAGDVLEFVPPLTASSGGRETILLRIYEFERVKTGKVVEVINPGHETLFRLPFSAFDQEDIATLRNRIPANTIIRKERSLTPEQWDRLKLDTETRLIEADKGSDEAYAARRENLQTSQAEADSTRRPRTPRLGVEGCCGKGCNGCLVFWHDPVYEKARTLLAKKKQGEMFDRDMRDDVVDQIEQAAS